MSTTHVRAISVFSRWQPDINIRLLKLAFEPDLTRDIEPNIMLENDQQQHLEPLSILFFVHAETNTFVIYGNHKAVLAFTVNALFRQS